jgi:ubiquinone/menaquinone biosynthesis C-methylase UbiE
VQYSRTMTASNPLATPAPWNLVASDYAAEVAPIFAWFAQKAIDLALLQPGARVLDVAAGPGTLSFLAARAGARVTAIDFSPAMIEQLRERASTESVTVETHVGDGQALPFADSSFDGAFSMFGLMFFADRILGLRELLRVLVPGAVAVVASWASEDGDTWRNLIWDAVREHLPNVPLGGSAPPLGNLDDCRREMTAAGFENVEVHEVEHKMPAMTTRQAWAWMVRATAPVALLRQRLGPTKWASFETCVLAKLIEACGEEGHTMRRRANLAVGRKRT